MLAQMCEQTDVSSDLGFILFPDNGYRECLANGSWAARVNYSECQEILNEEVRRRRPGPPSTSRGKGGADTRAVGAVELSRSWCRDSALLELVGSLCICIV